MSDRGVLIRPARPRDARSYLDMWRGVVGEKRYVRTETARGTVATYRRQFRRPLTPAHPRLMAVERAWRGRGVGSALMEAALRWAESNRVEKVSLEVYPTNEAAVALYRKFGFAEEGRMVRQSRKSYGYED